MAAKKSSGSKPSGTARKSNKTSAATEHAGHRLIDHDEIRDWAEERGASPACVKNTGDRNDVGMIRLDFPGYSGEESLQKISWHDWFEKFDENQLALIVQDTTAGGEKSNFNKLVKRTSEEHKPRTRTAG